MIFFSMEKPDPLAKHEEQSKICQQRPTKVNCNEEKQKKQPKSEKNTATTKKEMKNLGAGGGRFFYDRRHKKWHIQ
jgi:hypothetical protein